MNALKHIRSSIFLRHNLVFFVGSVAVGALNYLYYPLMGRLLEPAAFGEVQALISLFLQVTIFLSVLGLVTINIVANYHNDAARDAVVLEFEKLALLISGVALLLTIIFENQLERLLQFESGTPFILLMIALVASVPLMFRGAFLRGKKRFGLASAGNIFAAGGKLLFSALLVLVGLGTVGAIGGLICAQVLAALFVADRAAQAGLHRPAKHALFRLPSLTILRPELPYGLLVLAGSFVVTFQYSVDVLVVKHFFNPELAGQYAGVASVARIIFFLTASIALVLMPMVKLENTRAENRRLLIKSLILCFGVGLPILALFTVAPNMVVNAMMGSEFSQVASLLPRLSLAIFLVSVINLLVAYYLALRRYAIAPIMLVSGAFTYGLMILNHANLLAVVNSLLIGSLFMFSVLSLWAGSRKAKEYLMV